MNQPVKRLVNANSIFTVATLKIENDRPSTYLTFSSCGGRVIAPPTVANLPPTSAPATYHTRLEQTVLDRLDRTDQNWYSRQTRYIVEYLVWEWECQRAKKDGKNQNLLHSKKKRRLESECIKS